MMLLYNPAKSCTGALGFDGLGIILSEEVLSRVSVTESHHHHPHPHRHHHHHHHHERGVDEGHVSFDERKHAPPLVRRLQLLFIAHLRFCGRQPHHDNDDDDNDDDGCDGGGDRPGSFYCSYAVLLQETSPSSPSSSRNALYWSSSQMPSFLSQSF